MKTRWDAGQFKLRGKKHMHLSCKCCTVSNYKNECFDRERKEEILLAMIEYKCNKVSKSANGLVVGALPDES